MTLAPPAPAIVLAPSWDSYPALPTAGEAPLRELVRAEPCACGRLVRQFAGEDAPGAVGRHNETLAHRAWRDVRRT